MNDDFFFICDNFYNHFSIFSIVKILKKLKNFSFKSLTIFQFFHIPWINILEVPHNPGKWKFLHETRRSRHFSLLSSENYLLYTFFMCIPYKYFFFLFSTNEMVFFGERVKRKLFVMIFINDDIEYDWHNKCWWKRQNLAKNIQLSPFRICTWCCENYTNTHTYSRFSIVVCETFSSRCCWKSRNWKIWIFFFFFFFRWAFSLSRNNFFSSCTNTCNMWVREKSKSFTSIIGWPTIHPTSHTTPPFSLLCTYTSNRDFVLI